MKYLQKKRNAKMVVPNMEQGIWLNYLLRTAGYSQQDVATKAGVSRQMVQKVLYGIKTSQRVQKAIANTLGFNTWAELIALCRREAA